MMRFGFLPLVLLISTSALAEDCTSIKDDAKRLECWDAAAAARVTPTIRDMKSWPFGSNTGAPPAPETNTNLHIRDTLGAPYEEAKALSLSLTTSGGDRPLKTSAAFIYELGNDMLPEEARKGGWSTWAGAQWVKDSSSSKPVDGRVARLAAQGIVGSGHIGFVSLDAVQDNVAKTLTVGIRPEITPVFGFTEDGTPYSRNSAYSAYVRFGAQVDRVRLSPSQQRVQGNAAGLNLKLNLNYYPGHQVAPLRLFLDSVRAHDFYAGSDLTKRDSTFYDFGAEWMFTRPDKKAGAIAPTLSLHRFIGSNFLIGTSPTVKTVLAFGLKIN
ncbi:hypothetical protein GPY61_30260 [Massilia sp. NEAU-DD11]|uniref:Transporter n=1 Tax=Massilia cellulosiltytica TaxID=2683234 RepID=A0A7X3KBB7_9BURK|nr:hypothetical protein [Telluria cellulosilytica]MVW64220.1 hypothetical protein [Telluria cellulosilytica]